MKLTINLRNEQEEKVLLAFLDSLQYDYTLEESSQDIPFEFKPEEIATFNQLRQDVLDGKAQTRSWENVRDSILGKDTI